jgi:hypothetical protein
MALKNEIKVTSYSFSSLLIFLYISVPDLLQSRPNSIVTNNTNSTPSPVPSSYWLVDKCPIYRRFAVLQESQSVCTHCQKCRIFYFENPGTLRGSKHEQTGGIGFVIM